jgi:DNA-binding transcriptional LysR family regulator
MDKLRALQYFASAAAEKSLSAAARSHGVSAPAVAKLINALEKVLGAKLFDRTARGLTLNRRRGAVSRSLRAGTGTTR